MLNVGFNWSPIEFATREQFSDLNESSDDFSGSDLDAPYNRRRRIADISGDSEDSEDSEEFE